MSRSKHDVFNRKTVCILKFLTVNFKKKRSNKFRKLCLLQVSSHRELRSKVKDAGRSIIC